MISGRKEFSVLMSAGNKYSVPGFTFFYVSNNKNAARFAVAVAKRNFRLAVARSKVKRMHRECFRTRQPQLKGYDIIVLPRLMMDFDSVIFGWNQLCQLLEKY